MNCNAGQAFNASHVRIIWNDRTNWNGVSLLFRADDTTAAEKLPEGDLRPDARMLAEERRRPADLPRDSPVPATQESRLQARRVQRYLIQRTGRLEPDPAFYDRRAQRQLVELPLIDQARSSQTKLVPRWRSVNRHESNKNEPTQSNVVVVIVLVHVGGSHALALHMSMTTETVRTQLPSSRHVNVTEKVQRGHAVVADDEPQLWNRPRRRRFCAVTANSFHGFFIWRTTWSTWSLLFEPRGHRTLLWIALANR